MLGKGDLIGGRFLAPDGEPLVSHDPARRGEVVFETRWSPARVDEACGAAHRAAPAWRALTFDQRKAALIKFREAISARAEELATAIVRETGKLRSEARVEVQTVVGRFDLVFGQIAKDFVDGPLPGFPTEQIGWHPHGVVAVIGPFNFPVHLCHAHVVPALALGNTVVVKPSEVAPWSGEIYAECALASGLPAGVLNVVQGGAGAGAALVANKRVKGLAFTGSWPVGRRILEASLDRPDLLVALEMGGKNACVVREDADLRQAVHEIIVSGYLSSGQRCTCADRILVHRSRKDELVAALKHVLSGLRFGDPEDGTVFAGPLATKAAFEKFEKAQNAARSGGAACVFEGSAISAGYYPKASLHVLPDGVRSIPGYTDVEVFGPDLSVEAFDSDDEAIELLNDSPYGFAHAVFTGDRAAFELFRARVAAGIVNWNRSTNQASPRLPFGGVGRSGNFRPAGAHAPRNLAYPVATQMNLPGAFTVNTSVLPSLPPPDLDRMDAQHVREEFDENERMTSRIGRPMATRLPVGGKLPKSTAFLERLYAGDRIVREKKPGVFDHVRSAGPWFVSIDDEPLSVLDAMSQTATMPAGFNASQVVRAYVEGEFGTTALQSSDTTLPDDPVVTAYAETLRSLVPELPHVAFSSCGAEANEKAFALCRLNAKPGAVKILAFEGSFHGRTLLSLHASYSPSKRVPFQLAGYEVDFVPFPVWDDPEEGEPADLDGYRALCGAGDLDGLRRKFGAADDVLLRSEVQSLLDVGNALKTGEYFCVDVEAMQSEGGDRYATGRFFRGLRLLTRAFGVSLIIDEVQTGYGLGGSFLWHRDFGLVDANGRPDAPDAVCMAKRAQVGVTMSRFPDPEPSFAFPASLVRGRIHARMLAADGGQRAERIQALVEPRLFALARSWPVLIEDPRCRGYAFGFDLPTPQHLAAFLNQRFWRGAIVFGAGDRTVRYRLNSSFQGREIELVFEAIHRSLAWLDAHPGKLPPEWEDFPVAPGADRGEPAALRVRRVDPADATTMLPKLLELEARAYEPARRDTAESLLKCFDAVDGLVIVAEIPDGHDWRVVGTALGVALENVPYVEGPDRDPMRGRRDTFYSMAITVDPAMQGRGVGRRLKAEQLEALRTIENADGTARYRRVSGRNRIGFADAMSRLNDDFGAYTVSVIAGQYGHAEGLARYYRLPLGPIAPERAHEEPKHELVDVASGTCRPLSKAPDSLLALEHGGTLFGPAVNKLTLCNYVTPAIVRACEWIGSLAPELPHLFLTSGRDETFDKSLRLLRYHRKEAAVAIGVEHGYYGHTSAAARSLTDPHEHRAGPAHFHWPRVPHPADVGAAATIAALHDSVRFAGGPQKVIGVWIEPVQERSGRTISPDFWPLLEAWRRETGVPVIFVETATGYYRSGLGAFAGLATSFKPDVLTWWGGGHVGFVHSSTKWNVPVPLTLVSTWDGDELSLVQTHHQLRAARRIDLKGAIAAWDRAFQPATSAKLPVRGLGLHRVLDAGDRADAIVQALRNEHIRSRSYPGGGILFSPALDTAEADANAVGAALSKVLG